MRAFAVLLSILMAAGCAAPAPMVDYDPSYDFSDNKTFTWISQHPLMRGDGAEGGNPLTESRLMQITEDLMVARGYTKVAGPESADLALAFTLGGREKLRVTSYPETYRMNYRRWGWGRAYYQPEHVDVSKYTEGTLSVDMYDSQDKKPVWHGVATRKVTKKMLADPGTTLRAILGEIFATFPPPAP